MSNNSSSESTSTPLRIGWASADITPPELPVLIAGQFYARVAEGVDDALSATALAISSGDEHSVFVSCDVPNITDELKSGVRGRLGKEQNGPDPEKVVLHGTHTHSAPDFRLRYSMSADTDTTGVKLGVRPRTEYLEFLIARVTETILSAWKKLAPGKIAYGLDYAVVGRNRRWVDTEGKSTMYGLNSPEARERFRHIEGYEDHSLNVLATYDPAGKLTGVLVNLPSPSQESEMSFRLSADFWCETREEMRRSLGESVFILPQCSSAGDQTSRLIHGNAAHDRMLRLRDRTQRRDIAYRIAEAVNRILPVIADTAESTLVLQHEVRQLKLPATRITHEQAQDARELAISFQKSYEEEKARLEADPELRSVPHWYRSVTEFFRRANWNRNAVERYEAQQRGEQLTRPVEIHVIRLGEIAFASNPFEYYLDFGMQIKIRSPFLQTFLVQLAGSGTYVPSPRSVLGGGYGSVPASNPVGPEGGQILADETVEVLRMLASRR